MASPLNCRWLAITDCASFMLDQFFFNLLLAGLLTPHPLLLNEGVDQLIGRPTASWQEADLTSWLCWGPCCWPPATGSHRFEKIRPCPNLGEHHLLRYKMRPHCTDLTHWLAFRNRFDSTGPWLSLVLSFLNLWEKSQDWEWVLIRRVLFKMPEDIALFDVGTHSNTAMKELLW